MKQEVRETKRGSVQTGRGTPAGTRAWFLWYALCVTFIMFCCFSPVYAEDNTLDRMTDDVLSFFKPLKGSITRVEGKTGFVNIGSNNAVRKGMRLLIVREEAPFRHPVTKELLGKMEAFVGRIDIKDVSAAAASGVIIEGEPKEGDIVRVSEKPVNILFCQSKNVDWQIADSYYRKLKETGRFTVLDTALETDDPAAVIDEAKRLKAEAALLLTARKTDTGGYLTRTLFWASDGVKFDETETKVDAAFMKEGAFGAQFIKLPSRDAWLELDAPAGSKLLTACDVDGDGRQEIVFSSGKDISVFTYDAELHPALGGVTIHGAANDDHLWLDSIDLNKNGRDEIIVTSMRGDSIVSSVYEYSGNQFALLYQTDAFLRKMGDKLIAQPYSRNYGFDGKIAAIRWEGEYKKGEEMTLPPGVAIYDFIFFEDPHAGRLLLAYDEGGYFSVYDGNGQKLWRSKQSAGSFLTTFKKFRPPTLTKNDSVQGDTLLIDRGEWSVKDRLYLDNKGVLFVTRVPLLDMVKGIGYKKSQLRTLRWTGLSMEEEVFIDNIGGTLLDYTLLNDKVIVLASPLFGIKPGNILKGESPIKTELFIYSLKGI